MWTSKKPFPLSISIPEANLRYQSPDDYASSISVLLCRSGSHGRISEALHLELTH